MMLVQCNGWISRQVSSAKGFHVFTARSLTDCTAQSHVYKPMRRAWDAKTNMEIILFFLPLIKHNKVASLTLQFVTHYTNIGTRSIWWKWRKNREIISHRATHVWFLLFFFRMCVRVLAVQRVSISANPFPPLSFVYHHYIH